MNRKKMKSGSFSVATTLPTTGKKKTWTVLIGTMLFCTSAYIAVAQGADPILTVNDLAPCKNEIAKLHQMHINSFKSDTKEYCASTYIKNAVLVIAKPQMKK